jgi:hypothetical protein
MTSSETYLEFCNKIQHVKSTLIAKVNFITNAHLRQSKVTIYNNMAMNVFLYNLPEELLHIVRLKGCNFLETALGIVLEEVNFLYQYNSRIKMLKPQHFTHYKNDRNYFANDKNLMPIQLNVVQPQQPFKYGIPHNAQVPKFKFGIPQSKNIKLLITQQ